MKFEELTKTQIVLLTLLVSFVTSIATGIVTVSLVDQAPPAITQTINRVVERTIEKVTPSGQGASVITKETTVVVKDEDLITKSIEQNSNSLVDVSRIISLTSEGRNESFVGLGIILSPDGLVAIDVKAVSLNSRYSIKTRKGELLEAEVLTRDIKSGVALLRVLSGELEEEQKLSSANLGDSSSVKLGQTVIALGGRERKTVSIGIISSLITKEENNSTILTAIETNLDLTKVAIGAPIINLFGEIIGINSSSIVEGNRALPIEILKAQIIELANKESEEDDELTKTI